MKPDASFRPARRWILVVIVIMAAVLTVIVVARRSPQEQVANTVDAGGARVRANPVSAEARANISSQHIPAPTTGPAVTDELCGVNGPGRVRTGNETIEQHVARLTQRVISHWQSALAASNDPRHQAIGFALTNSQPGGRTVTPEELTLGIEASKDTPVNNNLVLLAIETGDPAIYSLAIGQCRGGAYDMAPGPCQALSWEHWANIDPDNATPWLWIAARAERAGDQEGVEEALAKSSAASRVEAYASALSALALGALPGNTTPLEKAVAGADVISILRVGTPMEILSLCSETAIQQPLRKRQCSAIATALANKGSTFIDVALASRLADRLGSSQETRAALTVESNNARAALIRSYPWRALPGDGSGFRCDTVLAYDSFVDALAVGGNERAALRAVVASGRSADGR